MTPTSILWFRRDLRLHDHAAIDAADEYGDVLGVFVVDPILWDSSGPVRREWLRRSLLALNESMDGRLCIVRGRPADRIVELASEIAADRVYVTADFGTYGKHRDNAVSGALAEAGKDLVRVGTPYAIAPGTLNTQSGTRFRVFTPFYRNWLRHLPDLEYSPAACEWLSPPDSHFTIDPVADLPGGITLPRVGEAAAIERWAEFAGSELNMYPANRDRPDRDATSRLSAHIRWGEIHPLTLLRDLQTRLHDPSSEAGAEAFRRQLAWRDFYADVWDANPASGWRSLDDRHDDDLQIDTGPTADSYFDAWRNGRTGYPIVDAGMRQLRATGWMHNRVRMITASFLVKDLHLPWQRGAAEFMYWLRDGEIANNQHNWQWVAGCGTDAAPFHRVFNPTVQGLKFDPEGDYVREWIPELRMVAGAVVHEPWKLAETLEDAPTDYPPTDYPPRIVDHVHERQVALDRFAVLPPRNS